MVPWQLRTPRLVLTRISHAHLADLVALDADPQVMAFISGGEPNSRGQRDPSAATRG